MPQEDQTQKCSNNSSSGNCIGGFGNIVRSSKKQKPKKAPQRGLGVAQLERIRLEEQKKDAAIASPTALPSSQSSTLSAIKSSPLSVPTPNYHPPDHSSSSSNPFPADLSSPNSIFRPSSSVHNIEIMNLNTVPLKNPVGWSSVPIQGHGNVGKLYNSREYSLENENSGVEDPGSAFPSSLNNLPYGSIPIWPLPSLMQRAHQFEHPSSSSMVYESSASSSVLNFQMEPPSNQSYYNNHPPLRPEEDKMVGMKRMYPFSLDDNPPCFSSSLHHKFPPIVHPRISRSEDSALCGNGHTPFFEPGNTYSREVSSCSTYILEPSNSKKCIKENEVFNGGFLTLAPPTTTSMSQGSKLKHLPHFLAFHNPEFPDFESLPYQGSVEEPTIRLGPEQRHPYYSFFPQSIAQTGQATSTMNNCNNGEAGESVDLNLRL